MAPKTLGKYTLLEKIGAGATGEVFKAHDPQLGRLVAIKILRSEDADGDVFVRFQREGMSIAQLNHPNIVNIFEVGEQDGKLFMALELLDGLALKQVIDSRIPLSLEQKLRLMEQICDAVGFMHSRGVFHRDLKPANIHVLPEGLVKIIDLGLVRLASSHLTVAGMLLGTPFYMSPEQIQGKSTSAASDVFSLGAIFYELLSYHRPFRSPSLFSVQVEISHQEHEPLSDWVPELPESLIRIVDKALSKLTEDRFPDATELLRALRGVPRGSEEQQVKIESGSLATVASFDRETVLEKTLAQMVDDVPQPGREGAVPPGATQRFDPSDLAQLLRWCSTNQKTGTLRAHMGSIEKAFIIQRGHLASSKSNSPRETLGQFLIGLGYITEEELVDALLQQERAYARFDLILLAKGIASESALLTAHEFQTTERICDCFLWHDGGLTFEEGQIPENVAPQRSLDLRPIIREGLHRAQRWEAIQRVIPTGRTTFKLGEDTVTDLSDEDRDMLKLAEKGATLAEIAIQMRAVEFHAASRLLQLYEMDLVRVEAVSVELPQQQQVKDFRGRLSEGLDCFKEGKHLEALFAFEAALQIDRHSKAYEFVEKALRVMDDSISLDEYKLDEIPVLKRSLDELTEIELEPNEAFVLSRINGTWNVGSILKICPLSEQQILLALKRFLDEGLIHWAPRPQP